MLGNVLTLFMESKISHITLVNMMYLRNNIKPVNKTAGADAVNIFKFYKNFNGIMTSEDFANIEYFASRLKGLSPDHAKEKLAEIGKQIIDLFGKDYGFFRDNYRIPFIKSDEIINRSFYKKLLRIKHHQAAITGSNTQEMQINPTSHVVKIGSTITDPRKIKSSEKIVIHPIEVAMQVLGYNDVNKISANKLFGKMNLQDLIKLKLKLLAQINSYNHKKTFAKSDKNNLKKLVDKFLSIDSYLKAHNINLDTIERYIFNEINFGKLELGQNLSEAEIIIDKCMIYNHESKKEVSSIITFSQTSNDFQLRMYSILPEKNIDSQSIKEKLKYLLRVKNFEGINAFNEQLQVMEKKQQEKIAQVKFRIVNKSVLKQEMLPYTIKDIDNIDKAVLIENLENCSTQKYNNTAIKFIRPLTEILSKNTPGRVFLKARSFNNTNHSPAALYLRWGCIPLFDYKESLLKELFNKKRIQENDGIWFECVAPPKGF